MATTPTPSDDPPHSLNALIDSFSSTTTSETPTTNDAPTTTTPPLPSLLQKSPEEMAADLNRVPLFMRTLDETDGEGGENVALAGLRALAYEGLRWEVAANFRESGNECAREKQWGDARGFYDQALATLREERGKFERGEISDGEFEDDVEKDKGREERSKWLKKAREKEMTEEEQDKVEREIEEACYVNRALCNLELRNYRACTLDCAKALILNPNNIKAFYRSGMACLALDKLDEAQDACERGLLIEQKNVALKALSGKIGARQEVLRKKEDERKAREDRVVAEKMALQKALKERKITQRSTKGGRGKLELLPKLDDPINSASTLSLPTLLLYPLTFQSDLIQAFEESHTIADHLAYILPPPWDEYEKYNEDNVTCFMRTASGGVVKVGKKVPLKKLLASGTVETVDGVLQLHIIPSGDANDWVEKFKAQIAEEKATGS